jgi:hypothetical protein
MTTKKFDCLKLKAEAQRRCAAKLDGMSSQEKRAFIEKTIHANPVLYPVYEKAKTIRFGKVAEAKTPYINDEFNEQKTRNKER